MQFIHIADRVSIRVDTGTGNPKYRGYFYNDEGLRYRFELPTNASSFLLGFYAANRVR